MEAPAGSDIVNFEMFIAFSILAFAVLMPRFLPRILLGDKAQLLGPAEMEKLLADHKEIKLVDVRSKKEFQSSRIKGAKNIELTELYKDQSMLPDNKEWPIALICQTEKRSIHAARLLHSKGYKNIAVLKGGMGAWRKAGKPTQGKG